MGHPLIDEFVGKQSQVELAVRSGDVMNARDSYRDLCSSYQKLLSSDVEDVHKGIAFEEVSAVYQSLQSLPVAGGSVGSGGGASVRVQGYAIAGGSTGSVGSVGSGSRRLAPRDFAILSCLVVLLVGVLVVDPATVGFSVFGARPVLKVVNSTFSESSLLSLSLNESPSGLWLTGKSVGGNGRVLFGDRVIVDTAKDGLVFKSVCGEACSLSGVGKEVVLRVEVSGGSLHIDSVSYISAS